MTRRKTRQVLPLTALLAVCAGACGSDNLVQPVNGRPVILSLTAFPSAIGPTDSAIVVCDAMDPDADSLLYDWITDSRLTIKGARPGDHSLYSTRGSSRVFYRGTVVPVSDTAFVQCMVRDDRGGVDGRIVLIILR